MDKYTDEWIKMYEEGMSIREIAKTYKVAPGSVSLRLRKKIELRPKSDIHNKDIQEKIIELYTKGNSIGAISKKYKISWNSVKKMLLKSGFKIESKKLKYEHLIDQFKKDYLNGMSLSEIHKKYDVSIETVSNYLAIADTDRRCYSEALRKYTINDNYFDNVDINKSFELGFIFSKGTLHTVNTNKFLELACKDEFVPYLQKILNSFSDLTLKRLVENSNVVRVSSPLICNRMKELGLGGKFPDKNIVNMSEFLKGFILGQTTIYARTLHIHSSVYNDELVKHLREIGITAPLRKNAMSIGGQKDLKIFAEHYPFIIDRIKESKYANEKFYKDIICNIED